MLRHIHPRAYQNVLLRGFLYLVCNITVADGETTVTTEEGDRYGWLEEIEVPENSQMDAIEYLGPQVIEPSC